MYVRWKILISLGVIFWCLSCLKEYFWVPKTETSLVLEKSHPIVKFEDEDFEPKLKSILQPKEEAVNVVKIVFWNFVAFVSTLSVCFTLKSLVKQWWTRGTGILGNACEDGAIPLKKNLSSKIPIPITGKSSSTDIHVDGMSVILGSNDDNNKSCPNLRANESSDAEKNNKENLDVNKLNRVWSIRNMEKHCARLREEMINLQASSLKEHSSISKKMDALSKEKREFIRQLNSMHKENRVLKQKVEEMLEERSLLIQRLDCATKEIRINTKSKKSTMMKLEEALANAEMLKSNLEQISKDKQGLENKLILLNAEYTRLKEELKLQKESSESQFRNLNESEEEKEHAIDVFEAEEEDPGGLGVADMKPQKEPGDFNMSQTEDDMKKMQQKLMNLEKSLENFKFRQAMPTKDENKEVDAGEEEEEVEKGPTNENQTVEIQAKANLLHRGESKSTIDEEPSTNSICTEASCPLEHRECTSTECFLKNMDHKLHLEENTDFSSGDESMYSCKPFFRKAEKPQENLSPRKRPPVKYIKSSISDDRLSAISERVTTTGEESGEDFEPQRRISESPEFQNFLRKVIEPPPIDPRLKQKLENTETFDGEKTQGQNQRQPGDPQANPSGIEGDLEGVQCEKERTEKRETGEGGHSGNDGALPPTPQE